MKNMRYTKLTNILVKDFGCDVRQSKGSEIVIYRVSAEKIYKLGKHKRNDEILGTHIKKILKRLCIPFNEFVNV